jgi:hypothetical protein
MSAQHRNFAINAGVGSVDGIVVGGIIDSR